MTEFGYTWLETAAASALPTALLIPLRNGFIFWRKIHFIGRSREDDLRPGIRSFPVGEYVVVYRIDEDGVFIINIVRGSRNLRALLGSQ